MKLNQKFLQKSNLYFLNKQFWISSNVLFFVSSKKKIANIVTINAHVAHVTGKKAVYKIKPKKYPTKYFIFNKSYKINQVLAKLFYSHKVEK